MKTTIKIATNQKEIESFLELLERNENLTMETELITDEEHDFVMENGLTIKDLIQRTMELYQQDTCDQGGDTSDNCAGCAYSVDHYNLDGVCTKR